MRCRRTWRSASTTPSVPCHVKTDAVSWNHEEAKRFAEDFPFLPGFIIPADELKDHNCVRELRTLCHSQQQKLAELKTEITDQNLTINELKRELNLIKDFMRAMRVSNPAMRAIADQMERDEVLRWSNSLQRARVTRWGGMISTPDDSLQVVK